MTLIHQRVKAANEGKNPTVICKMPSGWAVLGDSQFILGYTLLLPDPKKTFFKLLLKKHATI